MSSPGFHDAFADLAMVLEAGADAVLTLPLEQIDEDPNNPRRVFDADDIEGLAETLKSRGLKQPIVVRPAGPDGRYQLRYGARRLRAAKAAGFTEIRAIVEAGDDGEVDALTDQLIENEQRAPLSTAEMASAVSRLLDLGQTQAEIARRLGRGKDVVALYAAVRQMPAGLQTLAERVGPRTLYELWAAWKQDATHTGQWLAGREPASITQAEARALALQTRTQAGTAPPSRPRKRSRGAGSEPVVSAMGDQAISPTVQVKVGRRTGRLALDRGSAGGRVWIVFDDGNLEPANIAAVKLVAVEPGS